MAIPRASRKLDFIIVGTQKGGTTSLWQYIRGHPSIWMPADKEAPFFCHAEGEQSETFGRYMDAHFGHAPEGGLLGKATPHYMMGAGQGGVEPVASRIATALPDVRLIALLRDPIDRAISHYRMSVLRGIEKRDLEDALVDQLEIEQLWISRRQPTETNSHVIQGEYGRILSTYHAFFPAEQIHVEMTADLARDPGATLDRILAFLSLSPGYRPERLGGRHHRGGTRHLLDAESHASLLEFMEEHVWPNLGNESERVRQLFQAFLAIWDIAPDDPPPLSPATRGRLEAHYENDAETLAELGVAAPWLDTWRRRRLT